MEEDKKKGGAVAAKKKGVDKKDEVEGALLDNPELKELGI